MEESTAAENDDDIITDKVPYGNTCGADTTLQKKDLPRVGLKFLDTGALTKLP